MFRCSVRRNQDKFSQVFINNSIKYHQYKAYVAGFHINIVKQWIFWNDHDP